jgi:hypothetical protein
MSEQQALEAVAALTLDTLSTLQTQAAAGHMQWSCDPAKRFWSGWRPACHICFDRCCVESPSTGYHCAMQTWDFRLHDQLAVAAHCGAYAYLRRFQDVNGRFTCPGEEEGGHSHWRRTSAAAAVQS